jgi:hypothetical protein
VATFPVAVLVYALLDRFILSDWHPLGGALAYAPKIAFHEIFFLLFFMGHTKYFLCKTFMS